MDYLITDYLPFSSWQQSSLDPSAQHVPGFHHGGIPLGEFAYKLDQIGTSDHFEKQKNMFTSIVSMTFPDFQDFS